ncbi:phosphatase PAP2 family protein [Lysinibacillus sphaericus]|uniref:Phosphatidylglycerophosphatase n=2 Tax=Lysinibacillus TaxID=400634 RepID=A0A2S0K6H1_LYSSH|nr:MULTISPECIES: phosphatase PAP2 family protein [Lysinibacillus]AVK98972.1 phosphatidylglycerophosphatase [Lysinibacillus sphaericus]MCS1381688.1 phosphatase PAP2 family protein [Lysinibacillus sphaericus]MED4545150.1 phosphatase PAP2 family protein [Lysinibacillus sphaericus]TKI18646.1 phosphatase PAP2 family protein [Lysinibacillus sphaericus]TKI46670.1 phosphatase PAP2 family protein [Lysinibacillus tabacifolii]
MKKWAFPLAIVTLIAFFMLRLTYQGETIFNFDTKVADILFGNPFIEAFHYIGEPSFVITVALILMVYLAWRVKNYRGMLFVLLTFAGGNVLNQLLKKWIQRPRPEIEDQLTSFSFPSGHAMSGILYLFTVAYLLSENNSKARQIQLWVGAIALTILIGLSRIAGARHFASDVLAGWCVGYTWFIICVLWYERRKRLYKKNTIKQ